ncbi:MAG TPA: hypothetical protein VG245_10460, partial [Candidatus Dormibacteraeota bacterium]|nr:hypothetical protein [Candidatus Dormibacteraeota bacterium]
VLYLVPLLVLPAGLALDRVAGVLAGARPGWRPRLRAGLMAACVAVNAATFVLPDGSLLGQVGARDRHVAAVLAAVRRYATADVVVIADPEGPSSYRTAMYYLPEYTVVAVGRDRFGRAGEMFSNRPGAPEYDLARFDHVGPLRLPAGRVALILDPVVLDSVADPERLEPMRPAGDPAAVIYSVWLDPADPPRARGSWIWLRASDTLAHPVRA